VLWVDDGYGTPVVLGSFDGPVASALAGVPSLVRTDADIEWAVAETIDVLRRHGALGLPLPETARDIVGVLGELCDRLAEPRPAAPEGPARDDLWAVLRSAVNRELSGTLDAPFGALLAQEVMYGLERRGWRLVREPEVIPPSESLVPEMVADMDAHDVAAQIRAQVMWHDSEHGVAALAAELRDTGHDELARLADQAEVGVAWLRALASRAAADAYGDLGESESLHRWSDEGDLDGARFWCVVCGRLTDDPDEETARCQQLWLPLAELVEIEHERGRAGVAGAFEAVRRWPHHYRRHGLRHVLDLLAPTDTTTVVSAQVGPAELAAGVAYVHDVELAGDEALGVGQQVTIRDPAGALFAATVDARVGNHWRLTLRHELRVFTIDLARVRTDGHGTLHGSEVVELDAGMTIAVTDDEAATYQADVLAVEDDAAEIQIHWDRVLHP
jgi:hypothetical protein